MNVLRSFLAFASAMVLLVCLGTEAARADVYASGVKITQDFNNDPFDGNFSDGSGAAIRFVLNDWADSVVVEILPAAGGSAVRRLVAYSLAAGAHQVNWDGADDAGTAVPTADYVVRITTASAGYASWTQIFDSGGISIFTRGVDINRDPSSRDFGFMYAGNNGGPLGSSILRLAADGSPAGDTLSGYALKETIIGFASQNVWSAALDKYGWIYLARHGSRVGVYQTKVEYNSSTGTFDYTTGLADADTSIPNPIGLYWDVDTLYFTSDGWVGRAYFDDLHTTMTGWDTVAVLDSANFVRDALIDDDGYLYLSVQAKGAATTFGGSGSDGGWLEKYPLTGPLPMGRQDTMWRYALTDKPLELAINRGSASDASDDKIYMNYIKGTAASNGVYEFTDVNSGTSDAVTKTLIATSSSMSSAAGLAVDVIGNVILFENSSEHVFFYSPPTGSNSYTYTGLDTVTVSTGGVTYPLVTIAEARVDANGDRQPDRDGDTVRVVGIVTSTNVQTSNVGFFMQDETAGIQLFKFGSAAPALAPGHKIMVQGFIDYFRGSTEIVPDSATITILDSVSLPAALDLTIGQYLADPEKYESQRIRLAVVQPLDFTSADWPGAGSSANLNVWDGVDTLVLRVDSDTEVDGSTYPTFPVTLTGIGTQFTSASSVHDNGYQITPFFVADFVPINTPPLPNFALTAPANNSTFVLDDTSDVLTFTWDKAVDFNNDALIYQWAPVGFSAVLTGNSGADTMYALNGTTMLATYLGANDSLVLRWTVVAKDPTNSPVTNPDTLTVTLKKGAIVSVEGIAEIPKDYELYQNYPNPFNPTTTIRVALPMQSVVTLTVYNLLGQEVVTLFNNSERPAGYLNVEWNGRNRFGESVASGVYIYRIVAKSADGSRDFVTSKKLMLLK